MVYTLLPIRDQLVGLLEVVPQALLLAALLTYWVHQPQKRWLNWVMGIVFVLLALMPVLGLLTGG
jgi:hypothetical protein